MKDKYQNAPIWIEGLLGALILMIPAFFNGYPLVYSDTGTYLLSGIEWFLPMDRPFFYGAFLRMTHFKFSLWLSIFVQSFLIASCLRAFINEFLEELIPSVWFLALLLFLSCTTSLGWYCSLLLPDVFTALLFSTALPILFSNRLNTSHYIWLLSGVYFSGLVHFSNLVILLLSLLVISLVRLLGWWRISNWKKIMSLYSVVAAVVLTVLITNYTFKEKWKLSFAGNVFISGKLLDSGLLKMFLDENCEEVNYALCPYKDNLADESRNFFWNSEEPVQDLGGWERANESIAPMIKDFFSSPEYVLRFLWVAAYSTASQIFQNDVGNGLDEPGWYSHESSPPRKTIALYFPHEERTYLHSRQNINMWGEKLDFRTSNTINQLLLILSVILFLILAGKGTLSGKEKQFLVAIFVFLLMNAAVTANLSVVCSRLQARVSWIIVLMGVLLLYNRWNKEGIQR